MTWYESGNIKSLGDFKNNKLTGTLTFWFDDNVKRAEIKYKDGKRDGSFIFWHSNGQIKLQGSYLLGQVVGIWDLYYFNGKKHKETDTVKGIRLYWHDNGQMKSRQYRVSFTRNIKESHYHSNRNWNKNGEAIDSDVVEITGAYNHQIRSVIKNYYQYIYTYTYFDKSGLKEYQTDWCWSDLLDDDKSEEYGVLIYNFFDKNEEISYSIRCYGEPIDDFNHPYKPYSWIFYDVINKKQIFEYIIDHNTYKDIDLYGDLLKINDKKLNEALVRIEKQKSILDYWVD